MHEIPKSYYLSGLVSIFRRKYENDDVLVYLLNTLYTLADRYGIEYTGDFEKDIENLEKVVTANSDKVFNYQNHLFNETIKRLINERRELKSKGKNRGRFEWIKKIFQITK